MPEIVFLALKVAFLAALWFFVLLVARAVRTDVFGTGRATPSGRSSRRARSVAAAPKRSRQAGSPAAGKPAARLVVVAGALKGTTIQLGSAPVTLGRAADSTLVLDDDYASARHAQIVPKDGAWLVEDCGSTNGTLLGKEKVTGPTPVPLGVPIEVGKTVVELRA